MNASKFPLRVQAGNIMRHDLKMKALSAMGAFGVVTLAAAPVYASDTEVYVQTASASSSTAPTLMMVLDTSGSMDWCMTSDSTCNSPKRRVDVLASAMRKILLGDSTASPEIKPAPGYVKMGFSRFIPAANKGGWVRYPSRPLDAFVEINPNGDVTSAGATGNDDAVQPLSGVSVATGTELLVGGLLNQSAGFRFTNLLVPKGAEIRDAYIQLTAKAADSTPTSWRISVENSSTPSDFAATSIGSRTYGISTVADIPAWVAGGTYQVQVKDLVQSITDRSDWCGGNSMAFKVADMSTILQTRRAYSFEGAGTTDAYKPKLVVNYIVDPKKTDSCIKLSRTGRSYPVMSDFDDVQWLGGAGVPTMSQSYLTPNLINNSNVRTTAAVRLQNVGIPKNATITKAELVGTVRSAITTKPTLVTAYNVDNFPAICTGSSKSPTCTNPTSAVFTAIEVPSGTYAAGSLYKADVKTMVQSVVNRSGWASGNAMGFRLTNSSTAKADTGSLELFDANKDLSKAFSLIVEWTETITNLSQLRTVRDDLLAEITPAGLAVDGGTPLGSAYAEASLYMYGMHTSHDNQGEEAYIDPRTVDSNRDYISPIKTDNKCGANYIFMLTDGDPNDLANVQSTSKQILGRTCSNEASASGNGKQLNWYCMFDLAQYNASPNNRLGVRLRTNTVLFGPLATDAAANLKKMADLGQGNYYKAGDEAALVTALKETLDSLISAGNSIAAPGVAVNQLNKLTHLDQLYYAAFDPEPQKSRWEGNLKRYRLDLANEQIKDADNENAVDPATGFFRDGTRSYWSLVEDGSKAVDGGAAALLVPNQRTQYTYLGALTAKNQALTKIDLASSTFNTAAKPMTGASTDVEYQNLMYWYQGYVVPNLTDSMSITTSSIIRNRMGAGLHSKPALINYGYTGTAATAGDPDNQSNYIFFSTLEGTLHAIEAKTGKEKFSFIPGEKLSSLRTLYDNDIAELPQMGMDLSWTVYRKDANYDNQISGSSDKVYIYGGMRMGGKNYYALDVTNLNSPKLLFAINGGSTVNSNRFLRMGQTWSQPALGNIQIGSSVKTVLVFGGGYDPRHETASKIYTDNDLGNQLYIVDAFDGTLYWSASGTSADNPYKLVTEMKYSVPTAPKLVDFNGDGLTDTIYFGDLGGQFFRVDVNNGQPAASIAKRVRLLGKFGQTVTADVENQRRFYEPATAALFEDVDNINGGRLFAAVAFGSGYRSHPLDKSTKDRFFSILDFDVTRADLLTIAENDSSLRAPLTVSDLSKLSLTSDAGADKTKQGFYIDLPDGGEKSMASGLIINNELIFTTYVPTMVAGDSCTPVIGRTKLYRQCMPYGGVGDTCAWEGDRVQDNVMMGIGGEPQYLFQSSTSASGTTTIQGGLVVGSSVFDDGEYERRVKRLHRFREKRN
ncbi:MAG TPA: PilC/PilY family type IV pilus protein [Fluviicoccus sp.]|nr:PilC/PilY family type IV pilus protein [Fluviicoccus sp.]